MNENTNQSMIKRPINPGLAAADDGNMLEASQARIRASLPISDLPMWDELVNIRDTNEALRLNMQQNMMQIQIAYDNYWKRKQTLDTQLVEVIAAYGFVSEEYKMKLEQITKEQAADSRNINSLQKTYALLAKEYRSCAMQKRYMVHVTLVHQLVMAIKSAIHQHIHDQEVLKAISKDISDSVHAVFPMDAGSDL